MNQSITIVIPVYNREVTLLRTLRSISAQTMQPAEVILVDNNSTDRSWEIINEWAENQKDLKVKVLKETKPGACAARNKGLSEVKSDFVMFFDSDDEMLPNHVNDFAEAIKSYPDVEIFGRDIICKQLDGNKKTYYFSDKKPLFNHLFRGCLSTQRMVAKTDLVRKIGGWNESLPAWNDYELGVRLLITNPKILDLGGKPSVVTYQLEQSLTGTDFSSHPERWEKSLDAIEKELKEAGKKDALKWLEARRMILAAQYALECKNGKEEEYKRNASMLSERMRKKVLSETDTPIRMKLIFRHNYHFKRLTWLLCKLFF